MHELEILREEFEVDEAARGIFQIPARVLAHLLGDSLPHIRHVGRHHLRIAFAAQHSTDHRSDARGELRRAGHHARPCERQMLPGPGFGLLIACERLDAGRHRPGASRWTQPHVDMIERAVIGLRRQRADQSLRQPREILRAIQRPRTVGVRLLRVEIVDDDEVEIGRRRHLAATELAERQQRGLLASNTAVAFGNHLLDAPMQRPHRDIGQPREGAAGLLGRHRA